MDATQTRRPSIGILRLNSPTKLNSKKRLSCLGLIEYRLGARNFFKALSSQGIREVLHRPFEPAEETGNLEYWHEPFGFGQIRTYRLCLHRLSINYCNFA